MDRDDLDADLARRRAQTWGHRQQEILNERPVPARRLQTDAPSPIAVRVRLEWAVDGEAWQDGRAVGWCTRRGFLPLVLVQLLREPRSRTACVWVSAGDVERRRATQGLGTDPNKSSPGP